MNDGAIIASVLAPLEVDNSWKPKAAGDFDGDGKSDVFWQNTDGRTSIWFMNGRSVRNSGSPRAVSAGWQVQLAADVDADGKSDLLWRKTDGSNGLWVMDGASIRLDVPLPSAPTSWNMVGTLWGTISPVN